MKSIALWAGSFSTGSFVIPYASHNASVAMPCSNMLGVAFPSTSWNEPFFFWINISHSSPFAMHGLNTPPFGRPESLFPFGS